MPHSYSKEKPSNSRLPTNDTFVDETWKCGGPYQHPVPKAVGKSWETVLRPLLKRDKSQCDAWKDEVENLLIFAGLFSAVVTAFLVESYKELQPDSNAAVVFLLSHIAARLDNASFPPLPTNFPLHIPAPSPPPSAFRINIFWSLSLVLSLTTVLIGIVSLQWLREHLRYPSPIKPMDQLALFHMRSEGLEKWYVHQIFTALPLLLQAALALFLVGLIDFLLSLGHEVAIPVIAFITIPLLFIIFTTALPTIQAFSLSLPLDAEVPSQCPYKSPQSRTFRRIVSSSEIAFQTCTTIYICLHSLLIELPLRLFNIFRRSKSKSKDVKYLYDSARFLHRTWHAKTWFSFDEAWLGIRNRHCIKIYLQKPQQVGIPGTEHPVLGPQALYDLTDALRVMRNEPNLDESVQFALYYCVEELTSTMLDHKLIRYADDPRGIAWISRQNQFLQTLLGYDTTVSDHVLAFSHLFPAPSLSTLYDENALLFFSTHGYWWHCDTIRQHLAELYTRLLVYCYTSGPHRLYPTILDVSDDFYDVGLLAPNRKLHLFHLDPMYLDLKNTNLKAFSKQYGFILKSIFDFATKQDVKETDLTETFRGHQYLQVLIPLAVDIQAGEDIPKLLEHITTLLTDALETLHERRADLLFYTVSLYIHDLLNFKFLKEPSRSRVRSATQPILPLLRQYQTRTVVGNVDLERRLKVGPFSDARWWSFLVQFPDAPDMYHAIDHLDSDDVDNKDGDDICSGRDSQGRYPRRSRTSLALTEEQNADFIFSARRCTVQSLVHVPSPGSEEDEDPDEKTVPEGDDVV